MVRKMQYKQPVECQNEKKEIDNLPIEKTIVQSVVKYSIGDKWYTEQLENEKEWCLFLEKLFAQVSKGHPVSFVEGNVDSQDMVNREIVTYTTRVEKDAIVWAYLKRKEGYYVHIDYDEETGLYTCTAIR